MALEELLLILGSQDNSREACPFLWHISQWHANTPVLYKVYYIILYCIALYCILIFLQCCSKKELCIEHSQEWGGSQNLSWGRPADTVLWAVPCCSAGKELEHEKPGEAGPAPILPLSMEVAFSLVWMVYMCTLACSEHNYNYSKNICFVRQHQSNHPHHSVSGYHAK